MHSNSNPIINTQHASQHAHNSPNHTDNTKPRRNQIQLDRAPVKSSSRLVTIKTRLRKTPSDTTETSERFQTGGDLNVKSLLDCFHFLLTSTCMCHIKVLYNTVRFSDRRPITNWFVSEPRYFRPLLAHSPAAGLGKRPWRQEGAWAWAWALGPKYYHQSVPILIDNDTFRYTAHVSFI